MLNVFVTERAQMLSRTLFELLPASSVGVDYSSSSSQLAERLCLASVVDAFFPKDCASSVLVHFFRNFS